MAGREIDIEAVTGKNKSLLGAVMTEDKIEDLAKKTWKPRGPKTEKGKKNSLRQLRPKVKDIDIETIPDDKKLPMHALGNYSILNETEREYYEEKWEKYTDEFEMNTSADEALLHTVIMEEIVSARLYKAQLTTPKEDLSKQMSESAKRRNDAIKALGISRTQRLGAKSGTEENIASLILEFDKKKVTQIERMEEDEAREEAELIKKKKIEFSTEINRAKEEAARGDREKKIKEIVMPPSDKPKPSKDALDIASLA